MSARIIRPLTGRIEVHSLRGPRGDEPSNRELFRTATGKIIRPTWVKAQEGEPYWQGFWTISREHLTSVAESIAIRDGHVEIEMHYSQTAATDAVRMRRVTTAHAPVRAHTMAKGSTRPG